MIVVVFLVLCSLVVSLGLDGVKFPLMLAVGPIHSDGLGFFLMLAPC